MRNRPDARIVYRVPSSVQKLSTLDLIKRAIDGWLQKRALKKIPVSDPANGMPEMSQWTNVANFAIIVDDEVKDVMRVMPRMASILSSQPRFVRFDPEKEFSPMPGWKHVDGSFVDPNLNIELDTPKEFKLKDPS
jgi:hypothetical protein